MDNVKSSILAVSLNFQYCVFCAIKMPHVPNNINNITF